MKNVFVATLALMCYAILSADDFNVAAPDGHNIVIVNNSGCNLNVFILGTKIESTRVPPGFALVVEAAKTGKKTVPIRIVGYRRDGSLAGTVERIYEFEREDTKREAKWPPWEILPGDL